MNSLETSQLHKFLSENDVKDVTEEIRNKKHSEPLKADVQRLYQLVDRGKKEGIDIDTLNPEGNCLFLFTNYTDIFVRIKKDKLDRSILNQFLDVLEGIEKGEDDQHSGALKVGKLLKKLYIDSALREARLREEQEGTDTDSATTPQHRADPLEISYRAFKAQAITRE